MNNKLLNKKSNLFDFSTGLSDLIVSLLNDKRYHIEFNGHLTNHNKHAVIALKGIGASDTEIKQYYDNYALGTPYGYGLELARPAFKKITENNWRKYLGKRMDYSAYYAFFDEQERKIGMANLLNLYVPQLIDGWVGSLTHPTIHLGWGLDVKNRCMIIEGLAYLVFSYIPCHFKRCDKYNVTYKFNRPFDAMVYISTKLDENPELLNLLANEILKDKSLDANIHKELIRSGLQYKIAKMLGYGHQLIYETVSWNGYVEIDMIWNELEYVVTILYLAYPGDFLILHLITSLYAMEKISNYLPLNQQYHLVKCFWVGMNCMLFVRDDFPKPASLKLLDMQNRDKYDYDLDYCESEWNKIMLKAKGEIEEHNPKLVYVLRNMWKKSNYKSIFRVAATNFTVTPELPESFSIMIPQN